MSAVDTNVVLSRDNITIGEGGNWLAPLLTGLGAVFIVLTFVAALMSGKEAATIALHCYHVGFLASLGMSLGALGFVMIFHQTNAGWVASVRRQFENVMSLVWVGGLLFLGMVLLQVVLWFGDKGVYLFPWMNAAYVEGDVLYNHKKLYLNQPFFWIRAAIYFLVWLILSLTLFNLSRRQDEDGDRWHTAKARKISSVGLLLFAFTTAFASFDWMMSIDHHWFSTMFGVYFFAGNAVACMAIVTLVLIVLRFLGRLHGAFTTEHLHDMSKLLFAFTVFWAYISFSQYFLIWYANIPEETMWFIARKNDPSWGVLAWVLPICHFIVPFLWLLPRPGRRSFFHVAVACVWLLVLHLVDLYFVVRPQAGDFNPSLAWVDVLGVLGPVLVFVGVLARQIARGPLVAVKDPRLGEALEHKNYV